MGRRATGGMHVDRVRSRHTLRSGETREYTSPLLRRSFRKPDGRVRKETLANLSALPGHVRPDRGRAEGPAAGPRPRRRSRSPARCRTGTSPPCTRMAAQLGLPALLGPAGRQRDLALALIISRVVRARARSCPP